MATAIPLSSYYSRNKLPPQTRFFVSMSPPEQASLYSDLELMMVSSANHFLKVQKHEGRMTVESLAKILQNWAAKGRPQVIEFMFDQNTQRDLVVANIKTFRFSGPQSNNILSINSMMHAWKGLARDMTVRTFCSPDTVIRKQLHDIQHVLELLGCPSVTLLAFWELRLNTERRLNEAQKQTSQYEEVDFGVEKTWNPHMSEEEIIPLNPFA